MCQNNAPGEDDNISSGPSLEVDSDERDSAFGDGSSRLTMSVTDSVYDYRYENGRRYHAYSEGKYPVPNDEIEKDRLDLQHHAFRLTLDGGLYRAPISKDIHHVLDVGTGTGIWAIEFADASVSQWYNLMSAKKFQEHPSAEVIGTDLSPIQPTDVPPNCSFLIDDFDNDWVFRQQFDYIHSRAMVAAMKDWNRFLKQAYDNLKPGGYLEIQDFAFPPLCTDPTVTDEISPLLRWSSLFMEAAGRIGIDGSSPMKIGPILRDTGFEDVECKIYKWPIGRWAKGDKMKLLGKFAYEDLQDWLPSSCLGLFTRVLKWSRNEVEVFLSTVRKELKEEKHRHFYARAIFWVARKPEHQTGPSTFDTDIVPEEEAIESDEERTSRLRETDARDARAASEQAETSSQTTLVEPTEDLHIASPPATSKEEPKVEKASSKPTTSAEAFKDSMLSRIDQAPQQPDSLQISHESEEPVAKEEQIASGTSSGLQDQSQEGSKPTEDSKAKSTISTDSESKITSLE